MSDLIRRRLLKGLLALLGLFGGAVLLDIWSGARRFSEARWQRLLPIDQLPPDGVVPLPQMKVALLVSPKKIAAISLECTHLGCLVTVNERGFYCPCHGSEFGPRGQVYNGPATRDLPWHRLRLHHGAIWVLSGRKQASPFWHPREESPA